MKKSIAFLAFVFVILFGFFNHRNVAINAEWNKFCYPVSLIFGVFILLIGIKNPKIPLHQLGILKKSYHMLMVFLSFSAMGYFFLLLGLPTIWSKLAMTAVTSEASVIHVFKERKGRGCSFRIELSGGPLPESMTPCVSKEIWDSSREGGNVNVSYTNSFAGLVIEDISLTQR